MAGSGPAGLINEEAPARGGEGLDRDGPPPSREQRPELEPGSVLDRQGPGGFVLPSLEAIVVDPGGDGVAPGIPSVPPDVV